MSVPPDVALERILEALEVQLIAARDDEIVEAAKDLGMNPAMKGSAAFADIRFLLAPGQFNVDRWGAPIAEPAEKNGTPSARPFSKSDAPRSR